MSYYTALIAGWNSATQPPTGVTGTPLTGLTTSQKITAVNAWTIVGPALTPNIPVSQIIGTINSTDFLGLTALQLQQLQFVLQGTGTCFAPVGGTIRSVFASVFTGKTTTLNALSALVATFDSPPILWVTAPAGAGLNGPVNLNDCSAAGLT